FPMTDQRDKFWDMIEDHHACMLVTHGPGGTLHARPMHAIPDREKREILFYTQVADGKAHEIASSNEVCLTFVSHKKNDYIAVQGTAELTRDRELIEKHWNIMVKAWFPEGKDDPNIAMIRVKVRAGEYWDSSSSDISNALRMMTAAAGGRRPDMGDNERVRFS
ncbi:MAG TPA: pyridoxamine 5'-phosphate oxidase family protein, partial [Paracoccaceae bacterium]|nr:pyridoxamine 5'-phosphate oxidase family protein [Paracoccaceae bacterium]